MTAPFIAEIKIFGGNFAPRGYAFCFGQILAISQNTALFSLVGTTYGGNGTSTFALPDLRGRAPMGTGSGPGLSQAFLGEQTGEVSHTLLTTELPAHNHALNGANVPAPSTTTQTNTPVSTAYMSTGGPGMVYAPPATTPAAPMAPGAIGITGGSQPHNNRQPYLGVNYIIALQGIFPARN